MIRAAAALLALAGPAAAEDFVTLRFGDAIFGVAAPDVMTADSRDGPALMILLRDRVHNSYVAFTNAHMGKDGVVSICGTDVGPLRLRTSVYFATMLVEDLSDDAVAYWIPILKSRTCPEVPVS